MLAAVGSIIYVVVLMYVLYAMRRAVCDPFSCSAVGGTCTNALVYTPGCTTSITAQCNAGKYVLSPGLVGFAGWSSLGK